MEYKVFEQAVAAAAARQGIGEYELYYQRDAVDQVGVFEGQVEKFASSVSEGVCFRCIADGRTGQSSTELLTEEEAEALVERALESARHTEGEGDSFHTGGGDFPPAALCPETDTALNIEKALSIEKLALSADSRVEMAQSSVDQVSRLVRLSNSHGLWLEKSGAMTVGAVEVVVSSDGEKYSDYDIRTAAEPGALQEQKVAESAVEKATAQIGGRPVSSGSYPILLKNSQMAAFLEIFAGAFSAKNAQDGLSRLKGQEGQAVASPLVTIVDDPSHPDSLFPSPFDAEGVTTARREVVKDGVLQTLLHNRKTAAKAGVASTGNASKASYAAPVEVAPFTFFLQSGSLSKEELYKKAGEKAILITFMKGAHAGANPVTGDFSLESKGFLVENGIVTRPVQGITVAGNFFDLLGGITGIADDLEMDFSGGATAFGSPTVLVEGLSVAGE